MCIKVSACSLFHFMLSPFSPLQKGYLMRGQSSSTRPHNFITLLELMGLGNSLEAKSLLKINRMLGSIPQHQNKQTNKIVKREKDTQMSAISVTGFCDSFIRVLNTFSTWHSRICMAHFNIENVYIALKRAHSTKYSSIHE